MAQKNERTSDPSFPHWSVGSELEQEMGELSGLEQGMTHSPPQWERDKAETLLTQA